MKSFLPTVSFVTRAALPATLLLAAGCSTISPTPSSAPVTAAAPAPAPAPGAFNDDPHPPSAAQLAVNAAGLDPVKLAAVQPDLLATLLDPTAAPADAQEAAQLLGLVLATTTPVSDETLAALAPLLTDPARIDNARLALDRVPGAPVDALYLAALPTATGRTRLGLINSIGTRGITAAVPALATLLTADEATAFAAARALGQLGGPDAVAALTLVQAPLTPVTLNALLAAARTDPVASARVAAAIYRNPAAPLPQRSAALRALLTANPADAVVEIQTALRGTEPAFHAAALQAVTTLAAPGAAAALADDIGRYSPSVQVALVSGLGRRGDAGAVAGLRQLLATSAEPAVRLATLEALGRLPGTPAIADQLTTLAIGNSDEANAALAALARLNGPGVDAYLLDRAAATTGDPARCVVLISILAERNQTEAIPFLLSLRAAPDSSLRLAALDSLRAIAAAPQAQPLIDWILAAPSRPEQVRAQRALITVILREDDTITRADPVIAALRSGDAAARLALLPVLPRAAGAVALAATGELALDADERVATAATAALTRWPDPTALPVLDAVAHRTTRPALRLDAARGAARLLQQRDSASPAKRSVHARSLLDLPLAAPVQVALLKGLSLCADPAALAVARRFLADPATADEARNTVDALTSTLAGPPQFAVSDSASDAALIADGNLATVWRISGQPGGWLRADLHHARPVRRITLEQGRWEWDFPKSIDLQVSDNPDAPGPVLVAAEGLRYRTNVALPEGTRGRYLWIRLTGNRGGPWVVAELIVE